MLWQDFYKFEKDEGSSEISFYVCVLLEFSLNFGQSLSSTTNMVYDNFMGS